MNVHNMFEEKQSSGQTTQIVLDGTGTTGIELRVTPIIRKTHVVCSYVPPGNVSGGYNICD